MTSRRESFRRSLREKGSLELKGHPSKKREGEIMTIATSPVVTMAPTTPIHDAIKIMVQKGFRRIPIADPGTQRLRGIITATDLVNYLGGGEKYQLIQRKYSGNFYKAINEPVRSIMTTDVFWISTSAKIRDALRLMKKHNVGGLPVVDEEKRVWAIVTERDIAFLFTGRISGVRVSEAMTKKVVTTAPRISIYEAARMMIERGFRRLPVVLNGKFVGLASVRTILQFFGSSTVFKHLQSRAMAQVLQTSVLEATRKDVVTVEPSADVGEAAKLLQDNNVGSLPVVENERLVGILTERDFFKLID
ncbi:CBS domain-containing protein [Candidatus Bathyarchaeota archaeon]|nr:CBS domain-containing protein [Candidatus Bathyarchaeota archaeon]NIV44600.1 CBS domain-containing protein [Candidatus Bathyarchaeota archaeon]